jgi:hypothetical protein
MTRVTAALRESVGGGSGVNSQWHSVEKRSRGVPKGGEKNPRAGTLQPALRVRVGSRVEISNPHPPRWQPTRQTRGYAQPVINPRYCVYVGYGTGGTGYCIGEYIVGAGAGIGYISAYDAGGGHSAAFFSFAVHV